MKARSGKFINVQVLPNCSAGLDSDNAVVLSYMSESRVVWNYGEYREGTY